MTGLISEYFDGLQVWRCLLKVHIQNEYVESTVMYYSQMNDIYSKEEQNTSLFGNC